MDWSEANQEGCQKIKIFHLRIWDRVFKKICIKRCGFFCLCVLFLSGCSSKSTLIQPQINALVIANKHQHALKILEENEEHYGKNNQLLYLFDYGMVLQLAGKYEQSIQVFEQAKDLYDQLYTRSLTQKASTWLINDNTDNYRGEDFERVLLNIFQSLNFAQGGQFEEALVEARDVDRMLKLINGQYKKDRLNVYKEDAFARLLMGALYEAQAGLDNLNDAYISYKQALNVYEKSYRPNYNTKTPRILKENILTLASVFDKDKLSKMKKKFKDVRFISYEEKSKKSQVYLIEYQGYSPIKYESHLPIPLPNGILAKLAFPKYDERSYSTVDSYLKAVGDDKKVFIEGLIQVENISQIAVANLKSRQTRIISKATVRSAGKYLLESQQSDVIEKKYGEGASEGFNFLSTLFNLSSEQADVRSWQTLPSEIRISRLILEPGQYKIYHDKKILANLSLQAGETKFFISRTAE